MTTVSVNYYRDTAFFMCGISVTQCIQNSNYLAPLNFSAYEMTGNRKHFIKAVSKYCVTLTELCIIAILISRFLQIRISSLKNCINSLF